MIAAFPAPVLALAADKIAELEGGDALEALWALFTKCKGSLQDGPRLENISWRLWHRQLRASQHSNCRPPTPDSPCSELLSTDGALARGHYMRTMPHPSSAMPALPRHDHDTGATAYRSPAPSVVSTSSHSDVSSEFTSHPESQFHFLGDRGSISTPPPPSITSARTPDRSTSALSRSNALLPSVAAPMHNNAFIPSPSTSPTLWSQSSHSSLVSPLPHGNEEIQRQFSSTPNVRDANKRNLHFARIEPDHRGSSTPSGRTGAYVELQGKSHSAARSRLSARFPVGKIICDILPNHAFPSKRANSIYPTSVPSATPPRSSSPSRNRSHSSALQRPVHHRRRCPLPTPEHESYASSGVLTDGRLTDSALTSNSEECNAPVVGVTVTLTPSPSPSPVLGEKRAQPHQYPQPYPPSSGSSVSGDHSDDTQHAPATPTTRLVSKSISSPTTPNRNSATPNKDSPTTPSTPLRLNLGPRVVVVDPTPNPTPHPTPPTTPTLNLSDVPSFIQSAQAPPKLIQGQALPLTDADTSSQVQIAGAVCSGTIADATDLVVQYGVASTTLPIVTELASKLPDKAPFVSDAVAGAGHTGRDNGGDVERTLKPSDRRFFLQQSPEQRSPDSTSPSGSSGIVAAGSTSGMSVSEVSDKKEEKCARSRSLSPRRGALAHQAERRKGTLGAMRTVKAGRSTLVVGRSRKVGRRGRGSPGHGSVSGSSVGTDRNRSRSRSREVEDSVVVHEKEAVKAKSEDKPMGGEIDAPKARSVGQDAPNPKPTIKKSNSGVSIGGKPKMRGMLVMTKAKGKVTARGVRRTVSGGNGSGAAKRAVSGGSRASDVGGYDEDSNVGNKGKARATFAIGSTSSEGKDSRSLDSVSETNAQPSIDAAVIASGIAWGHPPGLGLMQPPPTLPAPKSLVPAPAPPPPVSKAPAQPVISTDPNVLKALLDNPNPAALLNPRVLEAAAVLAQPQQRRRVVVTNTSSEDYETESDSGDSETGSWASEESDDEVVVSKTAVSNNTSVKGGSATSKHNRVGPSSKGKDKRPLPPPQVNHASRVAPQPQRSKSETQHPNGNGHIQFALPANHRQQTGTRNGRMSKEAEADLRLQAAALEAQRQRELFTKKPIPPMPTVQRTRSGLLSQLMNPDPQIFPANHPYRTSYSAVDLRKTATLPRISDPSQAPPPVNGYGRPPSIRELPGPPQAALVVGSTKSAAMPLAQQVTVAQVPVNGSGGGSTGYRPKGRPQGQEMEDDTDTDDDNPDDKVQVSQSVAQQRLAALAGRRSASNGPGPQQQQQQTNMARRPPMLRALTTIEPQQSHVFTTAPQPVASPVAVPAPYNLPPPAPPSTPRTTRRMMLQTEMSESLRRNLLWERQVSKVMIGQRRRSSGAIAPGTRPGHLTATPSMVQLNPKTTDSSARVAEERERERQLQASQERDREQRKQRALARNRSWADDYHYSGW